MDITWLHTRHTGIFDTAEEARAKSSLQTPCCRSHLLPRPPAPTIRAPPACTLRSHPLTSLHSHAKAFRGSKAIINFPDAPALDALAAEACEEPKSTPEESPPAAEQEPPAGANSGFATPAAAAAPASQPLPGSSGSTEIYTVDDKEARIACAHFD
jgi:hypothetical protein